MKQKNMRSVALAALAASGLSFAASAGGVAKIDDREFDTLDEALAAVGVGQTVKVQEDCSLGCAFTNVNDGVTIDFGEKTVSYAGGGYAFTTTNENSKLTIRQGTFAGTGVESRFFCCESGAAFELNGITADQKSEGAIINAENASDSLIKACTIGNEARKQYAVMLFGGTVTIDDTSITVFGDIEKPAAHNSHWRNAAITVGGDCQVTFKGETVVRGSAGAVYGLTSGYGVTVDDGTFTAGENAYATFVLDHPWTTSATVSINNGTVNGAIYLAHSSALNITGGKFNSFVGMVEQHNEEYAEVNITGGVFDANPNIFRSPSGENEVVATAANKMAVKTGPDTWTIVPASQVLATPGENATLAEIKVGNKLIDLDVTRPYESDYFVVAVKPLQVKVLADNDVAVRYEANAGYHFEGGASEQTKSGTAPFDEELNLNGDDALSDDPPAGGYDSWAAEQGLEGDDAAWDAKPAKWGGKWENAFIYTFGEGLADGTVNLMQIGFDGEGKPVITTAKVKEGCAGFTLRVVGTTELADWENPAVLEQQDNKWTLPAGEEANFFRVSLGMPQPVE